MRLALADWKVIDNALIVVAELVANAVKIGDVFRLTISRRDGTALIEVWDPSEAAPDRRRRSADRVDGRGLLLVEACSTNWGWRMEEHGGKTVWALCDHDAELEITAPSGLRM